MGLVVAAGYLLSLSIGQEGGRDVESWAAHLHVVVLCPMYAMRVSYLVLRRCGPLHLVPRHRLDESILQWDI